MHIQNKKEVLSLIETIKEHLIRQERFGLLVMLGFDVAVFTPASYLRHRL